MNSLAEYLIFPSFAYWCFHSTTRSPKLTSNASEIFHARYCWRPSFTLHKYDDTNFIRFWFSLSLIFPIGVGCHVLRLLENIIAIRFAPQNKNRETIYGWHGGSRTIPMANRTTYVSYVIRNWLKLFSFISSSTARRNEMNVIYANKPYQRLNHFRCDRRRKLCWNRSGHEVHY